MTHKIFVTGATGFIGSNLVKRLVNNENEVTILVRPDSEHPLISSLNIKEVTGDITDVESIKKGMQNCDYVYHVAAFISFNKYDYDKLYPINVLGTRNVVDAALELGIQKLVHTSATATIGISKSKNILLDESSSCICENDVYAQTKRLAELEVLQACKKGLNAVIVNPSTVYGQGDRSLNSGMIIKNIYNSRVKVAPPGGTSVVSVDDVVEGHILAMEKGKSGERYILSDENLEYIDLFNRIARAINAKEVKIKIPLALHYPAFLSALIMEKGLNLLNIRPWLLTPQIISSAFKYRYFSSAKARKELGWKPEVNFETAVKNALEFYRSENFL